MECVNKAIDRHSASWPHVLAGAVSRTSTCLRLALVRLLLFVYAFCGMWPHRPPSVPGEQHLRASLRCTVSCLYGDIFWRRSYSRPTHRTINKYNTPQPPSLTLLLSWRYLSNTFVASGTVFAFGGFYASRPRFQEFWGVGQGHQGLTTVEKASRWLWDGLQPCLNRRPSGTLNMWFCINSPTRIFAIIQCL